MSGIIKDKHSITVKGDMFAILTDVSLISRAVYKAFVKNGVPAEEAKGMIDEAVEMGMRTKAEMKEKVKEKLEELIGLISEGDDDNDETGNTSGEDTEDTDR